jgi:hypothetical protein
LPKHYTFRTTRDTAWLDGILMGVPKQDRARFIRDTLIRGLGDTNRTQTEHKVTQTEHLPIVKEECVEEDIEKKLDNLFE